MGIKEERESAKWRNDFLRKKRHRLSLRCMKKRGEPRWGDSSRVEGLPCGSCARPPMGARSRSIPPASACTRLSLPPSISLARWFPRRTPPVRRVAAAASGVALRRAQLGGGAPDELAQWNSWPPTDGRGRLKNLLELILIHVSLSACFFCLASSRPHANRKCVREIRA